MIIVVQIPIIDLRLFEENLAKRIALPNWKALNDSQNDPSFVRSIGSVTFRKFGHTNTGENYFIKATRGIRFTSAPMGPPGLSIKLKYRRLSFDGYICGKYEVCFEIQGTRRTALDHKGFHQLLALILGFKVSIPIPFVGKESVSLLKAASKLSVQFLKATSRKKIKEGLTVAGVHPGNLSVFIESRLRERIKYSFDKCLQIDVPELSAKITKFNLNLTGKNITVWHFHPNGDDASKPLRELRLGIMKSNVFKEGLHFVLNKIESDELSPKPLSKESQEFQEYLKKCLSYLRGNTTTLDQTNLDKIIFGLESTLLIPARKKLEDNLEHVINIRKNYFNSIKVHLDRVENANSEIPKNTILILNADPRDEERLRLGDEFNEILSEFSKTTWRAWYKFDYMPAIKFSDLTHLLQKVRPAIVQFSGHGNEEGIYLQDTFGNTEMLAGELLNQLFQILKISIKCVLLINCLSTDIAKIISKNKYYVVGMTGEIGDQAAKEFAVSFYRSIGEDADIETAFKIAKLQIAKYPLDAELPVLWLNGKIIK